MDREGPMILLRRRHVWRWNLIIGFEEPHSNKIMMTKKPQAKLEIKARELQAINSSSKKKTTGPAPIICKWGLYQFNRRRVKPSRSRILPASKKNCKASCKRLLTLILLKTHQPTTKSEWCTFPSARCN